MAAEVKKEVQELTGTEKTEEKQQQLNIFNEQYREVGQMKRGDYMIHVFIEKARQLKVPEGNTVDPIVEVSCMGVRKYTTAKDDISATGLCVWNEHLFFEPKNVNVEDIEQAKINIKLLDKGYFKDAMIGAYEFDVAYIYFMKDHALMHKWLALSNPNSETFNEVAGYLKISITIAATGDEQIQITDDNGPDSSEDAVLMPPSIRPEYYQLKFRFFRAEKLPAMDMAIFGKGGSIDAYITTTYLNKKLKTDVKVQKEGGYVDWDQEFLIPCQLPIMSSRIVMKLFDQDNINDEIVGSLLFNIKDLINTRNGHFFWKNVYGSPLGVSGENTTKMNECPEIASTWKGRILMQVEAIKTEKPQILCQNLNEEIKAMSVPYLQEKEFEIIAEVGQGISLPWADKFNVMIKIADIELKTDKPLGQENTYCRWNQRFKQQTVKLPYIDEYDIGRVYVYLMWGNVPISYYKGNIEDFLDPNPKLKWVQLNCDLAHGKVKEAHMAGLVSIKLSIHNKSKNGPINFEQFDAWKKPPPKRLNALRVRAFIFQCRDLPAADSDGQSDPYIKLWDMSKEQKRTKKIDDNLNPLFYETLELSYEAISIKDMPPFLLDVYDWDMGLMGDDFIARCTIPIDEAAFSEDNEIPRPKWHPCKLKPDSPTCGEILCSFSIVEEDYNYKIPLSYVNLKEQVNFQEFTVAINVLGLRDLQSVGILPVKKAYVVFNLKSLVPPDEGTALENLKTQPSAAGANPTINTLIKFNLGLPADPLFCPRLSCAVHDYIFKGFSQPMIGSFIIPIGDLIHKLQKEREEETGAIEYINGELEKILKDQGITTYAIQEEVKESFENLSSSLLIATDKVKTEAIKAVTKVPDKMAKAPLLLHYEVGENDDEDDYDRRSQQSRKSQKEGQKSIPITPVRKSPITLAISQSGKSKAKGVASIGAYKIDKFNSGMKAELLNKEKEDRERLKRIQDDIRRKEAEEMKRSGGKKEAVRNVLFPSYALDARLNVYREQNIPPESLFMGLGFDVEPNPSDDNKKKHYRRFYPDELENIKEIMPVPTPFDTYDLKRGQSRGASKGFWPFGQVKEDDSGATTTEQVVGKFKGIVTVQSEKDRCDYKERKAQLIHDLKIKLNALSNKKTGRPFELKLEKLDTMEGRQKFEMSIDALGIQHLQITKHLADLESDETLKRLLLAKTKCIVRVYMISGYDLASRDNGGFSDPYLKLTLGTKTYNEREIYQLDNPNPDFYKSYDFEAIFPGCPPLIIDAIDYDDIFGDDLIGTTSIDLEDRFFSVEWQSIKNKPIEFRQIYHPSSSVSQGVLKLWVEINPTSIPPEHQQKQWDITPKAPEEFEIRVVVFDTLDIKCMDSEGTSDVYCKGFFDSKQEVHETDTHFRCQNGKASFNYRLVYTIKNDRKDYNFTLQAYDRDFFKSNDIIGEAVFDLKMPLMDCALTGRPLGVTKKYYNDYLKEKGINFKFKDDNSFYVPIMGKDEKGKLVTNGQIRLQIDIYPKVMAEANKVGQARQEPNHSPFLPPPVGRISFTLNPLKMFNQMLGPALRRKIYCYCCLALCLVLCVMLAPMIIGNLISAWILAIFGLS